jgi:autotransporter-associated beta strand protein
MKDRPKYITKGIKNLFLITFFFTLTSYESNAQTPTGSCGTTACVSFSSFTDCGGNEWKATMVGSGHDRPRMQVKVDGSHIKCLGYSLSGASYGGNWVCSSNSANQIPASSAANQYVKVNTSTLVVTVTTSDFVCSSSNEKENNTTDLDDAGSWTSSVPTSAEVATWEATVTGANATDLGSDLEFQGIAIEDVGGAITINSGNTLTIGTDGIDMSSADGNFTIASSVALGSNQDWDVNTSKTLTASGTVSGAYKISKKSTGTLTLSGTNTFTGGVDHDAGTLNVNSAAALGTTAGTLTVASGTIIDNTSGGAITTSNYPLSINNFTFTGTNDLNLGTGTTALASTSTITTSANDLEIGGVISGAYAMAKSGAGALTLSGANTFTSGITVNAGTLNIDNADALGATSGTLAISTGGTVDNTSGGLITLSNYPITLNGSFTFTGSNNLNMGAGAVLLGGSLTITATANDLTFGGVVSGAFDVTSAGSGNIYFTGESNSFTGQTDIGAGTVYFSTIKNVSAGVSSLGAPVSVGNGTVTIGTTTSDGALIFNGSADQSTDRVIDLAGTTGGATIDAGASNNLTFTSDFTATGGGDKTLSLKGSTSSNEIQGAIVDNSGANITSIDKQGSGNWILTGANTYTGTTTITAGTLEVGSGSTTGSIASSSVVNGAALEFNRSDALTYAGVISSSGTVTKKGGGTLTLTGGNTYTGNTTISAGSIEIGAAGVIADGSMVDMNGGGLITGSGAGYSETAGILDLSNSSTIYLGTGDHTLAFAASNGEGWTAGKQLIISGWNGGYDGTAAGGSDPKVFVGSASSHLSGSQLDQIGFSKGSYTYEADLLATGELVPKITLLPVELVHFAAHENDEMVDIEWVTASEINSDYFDVQRTGSDIIFESIGIVTAAGQSSSFEYYDFADYDPEYGINYYKLVEYDIDGTVQESKIIEVLSLKKSTLILLKTKDNGNAMFQLSAMKKSVGKINVTSINGQIVEKSTILINKGGNQFVMNTSVWLPGYYIMTIVADDLEPQSIKFLVR